jgi:hypothetical protein
MENLTKLELQALETITQCDFYDGRDSVVWDFSVYDICDIPTRSRSGVYGSLAKKGIIEVSEKEKSTYIDNNGVKQRNPHYRQGEPESNYGTLRITEQGYTLLDNLKLIDKYGEFRK